MWTDVVLGLGAIFLAAIVTDFLAPILFPKRAWIARLLVFLVLVWLVGSVWLGLPFLALLVLYAALVVVILLLRRFA